MTPAGLEPATSVYETYAIPAATASVNRRVFTCDNSASNDAVIHIIKHG